MPKACLQTSYCYPADRVYLCGVLQSWEITDYALCAVIHKMSVLFQGDITNVRTCTANTSSVVSSFNVRSWGGTIKVISPHNSRATSLLTDFLRNHKTKGISGSFQLCACSYMSVILYWLMVTVNSFVIFRELHLLRCLH